MSVYTLIIIITLITPLLLFQVISEQWDGMLGRCDITVTSDPVTLGDLSVQVVSGLGMSVMANPAHPSIITATVTAYNILYNHHQVREALPFPSSNVIKELSEMLQGCLWECL